MLLASLASLRSVRVPSGVATSLQHQRHFNLFQWYRENAKTPSQLRLAKDIDQGYWYEANQIKKDRAGKLQPGTGAAVIHAESAQPFPYALLKGGHSVSEALSASCRASPCTLLLVSIDRIFADAMVSSWRRPLQDRDPCLPVHELVLTHGAYYWLFPWLRRIIRNQIGSHGLSTDDLHQVLHYPRFFSIEALRQQLDLPNRYVPYPLLLDRSSRIRWRSIGQADAQDLEHLAHAIATLTKEDTKQR